MSRERHSPPSGALESAGFDYGKSTGEVSLLGIGFELAEPDSPGYGTPPATFSYDATGLDYFGNR